VDDDATLESPLLDVANLDLDQVEALPESVLRASLRRILAEEAALPEQFAAFQNSL
jgi:FXSXX-COOH protein